MFLATSVTKKLDHYSYQDMGMSSSEIRDQLCSEYGEKFTKAEASYAVKNLPNN